MKTIALSLVLFISATSFISDNNIINKEESFNLEWRKVKVTKSQKDIEGLTREAPVRAIVLQQEASSMLDKEKLAFNKLRRQAANKGCHIVLLSSKKIQSHKLTILGSAYK